MATLLPRRPLLTASWGQLAMLNYRIAPDLLAALVPRGTELDSFDNTTYVSRVGSLFADTRVLGLRIPFHVHFEELNLRFYVRRTLGAEVRRCVVFVKEIVPRAAIALIARWIYNEPYETRRMGHYIGPRRPKEPLYVSYSWKERRGGWAHLTLTTDGGQPAPIAPNTLEEFITEHYWGYTRQRDGAPSSTVSSSRAGASTRARARSSPAISRNSTGATSPRSSPARPTPRSSPRGRR